MIPIRVDNRLPKAMVFYCKDCKKVVDAVPVGRKFAYKCSVCQTKNIAFGSIKSIKNFYRIKDEGRTKEQEVLEEKKRIQQEA